MSCENCTRRKFLESSVQAASKLAIASPMVALLASCGQTPLAVVTAPGSAVSTDANNIATLTFANYPTLQTPGGSVNVTVNAASGSKDVYVTRVSASEVDTVSSTCTHQGCKINSYSTSTGQYLCACHGSIFSVTGSVVNGPATTPLPSYVSVVTATGVQVTVA
jgi:cytochrome b6-f complex iron-sulfur subunit